MQWYFQSKTSKPAVCKYNLAAEGCVTSCESKLECFEGIQKEENIYFAWDRIHRIEPVHTNGSVCLAQGLKKNDIVKECQTWCVCVCACVRACVCAYVRALDRVCVLRVYACVRVRACVTAGGECIPPLPYIMRLPANPRQRSVVHRCCADGKEAAQS